MSLSKPQSVVPPPPLPNLDVAGLTSQVRRIVESGVFPVNFDTPAPVHYDSNAYRQLADGIFTSGLVTAIRNGFAAVVSRIKNGITSGCSTLYNFVKAQVDKVIALFEKVAGAIIVSFLNYFVLPITSYLCSTFKHVVLKWDTWDFVGAVSACFGSVLMVMSVATPLHLGCWTRLAVFMLGAITWMQIAPERVNMVAAATSIGLVTASFVSNYGYDQRVRVDHNVLSVPSSFYHMDTELSCDIKEGVRQLVLTIAMTVGLFAGVPLPTSGKAIEEMMKRHSLVSRFLTSWDVIFDKFGDMVHTFIRLFYKYAYGETIMSPNYIPAVEKLINNVNAILTPPTSLRVGKDPELNIKVMNYFIEHAYLRREFAASREINKRLDTITAPLLHLWKEVKDKNPQGLAMRQEPVCIVFHGKPGVGKSYLMQALQQDLLKISGRYEPGMNPDGHIYSRCQEQEYWDGYIGQPIVVFDDFAQAVNSAAKPNLDFFDIIRAINIFPYNLHMASISEKANTAFQAEFVLLTTNLKVAPDMHIPSLVEPEAFVRRLHLVTEVSVVDEVYDKERKCIDVDLLRAYQEKHGLDQFDCSHWTFKDQKGQTMDYDALLVQIGQLYKARVDDFAKRKAWAQTMAQRSLPKNVYSKSEKWLHKDNKPAPPKEPEASVDEVDVPEVKQETEVKQMEAQMDFHGWAKEHPAIQCLVRESLYHEEKPEGPEVHDFINTYGIDADRTIEYDGPVWVFTPRGWYNCRDEIRNFSWCNDVPVTPSTKQNKGKWYERTVLMNRDLAELTASPTYQIAKSVLTYTMMITGFAAAAGAVYGLTQLMKGTKAEAPPPPDPKPMTADHVKRAFTGEASSPATSYASSDTRKSRKNYKLEATEVAKPMEVESSAPAKSYSSSEDSRSKRKVFRYEGVEDAPKVAISMKDELVRLMNLEAPLCQGADDLSFKVRKSMFNLFAVKNGDKIRLGTVFAIKGHNILVNRHYVEFLAQLQLEDGDYLLYQQHEQDRGVQQLPADFVRSLQDVVRGEIVTEFFLATMPKAMPLAADLTVHLISHKDIPKLTSGVPLLMPTWSKSPSGYVREKKTGFVDRLLTIEIPSLLDESITHRYAESLTYRMATATGDCGSPLLVQSDMFDRKIVGFHFGGEPGEGACSIITRDDIMKLDLTELYETNVKQIKPQGCANIDDFPLRKGSFVLLGTTDHPPNCPTRSSLVPSELQLAGVESTMMPARLSTSLAEDKPLVKGLMKNAQEVRCLNRRAVVNAVKSYNNLLASCNVLEQDRKILPYHEACAGIAGDPYYGSIARSKSAGWPFMTIAQGKTCYLGSDEWDFTSEASKQLKKIVADMEEMCARGEVPEVYFVDTLKDEKRPAEKVLAGKTRVFAASPLHFTILFRKYFMGFMAHVMRNRITLEACVGVRAKGYDWGKLARKLNTFPGRIVAGDFENFDGTVQHELFSEIVEIVNQWYSDSERARRIRRALWYCVSNSKHILQKYVYQMTHGQPSGNPGTAVFNSIYISLAFRYCWALHYLDDSNKIGAFNHFVQLVCYGDDWLMSVSRESDFAPSVLSQKLQELGMKVTSEDKTELTDDFRDISEVSFLKRGFVYDKKLGYWFAPLAEQSIREMTLWIRKTHNVELATKENMEGAMEELIAHPRDMFEKYERLFRDKLPSYALSYVPWTDGRLQMSMGTWMKDMEVDWI